LTFRVQRANPDKTGYKYQVNNSTDCIFIWVLVTDVLYFLFL